MRARSHSGFTLIELSIVLVIIGLLVGGVLVGRDLIRAAATRAGIAQIEQFRTAVHTFKLKYNALPGDLPPQTAAANGFVARSGVGGQGDNNGILVGAWPWGLVGTITGNGETAVFWRDLSDARLVSGAFNAASPSNPSPLTDVTDSTTPNLDNYQPRSKLDSHLSVVVWSGGKGSGNSSANNGTNYFSVAQIFGYYAANGGFPEAAPTMEVQQAYNADKKTDDGLPMTGRVTAQYAAYSIAPLWINVSRDDDELAVALAGSASTCFDNNNVAAATHEYSVEFSGGNGKNCALSFRF